MGGVATLTAKDIHNLSSPRTTDPSRYYVLAQQAEHLAEIAETSWDELSEGREILKALAYRGLEGPQNLKDHLGALRSRWALSRAIFKGEGDAVGAYLSAHTHLINAVLAAVEREQTTYQETLEGTLDAFDFDPNAGVTIGKDNVRDYLQELSDKAFS